MIFTGCKMNDISMVHEGGHAIFDRFSCLWSGFADDAPHRLHPFPHIRGYAEDVLIYVPY